MAMTKDKKRLKDYYTYVKTLGTVGRMEEKGGEPIIIKRKQVFRPSHAWVSV